MRHTSKKQLVRDLLEAGGNNGVTTGELLLAGCGTRYGARIKELRDEGLRIESNQVRPGLWRYRLVG